MVWVRFEGGPLHGFTTDVPEPEEEVSPILLDYFDNETKLASSYRLSTSKRRKEPWLYFWRNHEHRSQVQRRPAQWP